MQVKRFTLCLLWHMDRKLQHVWLLVYGLISARRMTCYAGLVIHEHLLLMIVDHSCLLYTRGLFISSLQVLSLLTMEAPVSMHPDDIRDEKVRACK